MPSMRGSIVAFSMASALAAAALAHVAPSTAAPAAPAASAPALAKPPANIEEVQEAIDHAEYARALVGISRILSPDHPLDYDRHAVLMLRAECDLQLKQAVPAGEVLEGIRKKAHEDASTHDEYDATAMIFLIHKSPGLLYTPKTTSGSKVPISILDRTRRKDVYQDLYSDELAVTQQMTRDSAFGKSLAPIIKVCDQLFNVQSAEFVATGDIANSKKLAVQLVGSARLVIAGIERDYDAELVKISDSANQTVNVRTNTVVTGRGARGQFRTERAGLSPTQSRRLAEISADCDLIADVIHRLRILADDPQALSVLLDRAAALKTNDQTIVTGGSIDSLGPIPPDTPGRRVRGGGN